MSASVGCAVGVPSAGSISTAVALPNTKPWCGRKRPSLRRVSNSQTRSTLVPIAGHDIGMRDRHQQRERGERRVAVVVRATTARRRAA